MSAGAGHPRRWTWARRATALGFLSLLVLGGRAWFPWLRGTTAATEALGVVPFVDPLAALESSLASRALAPEAWLGAGLLIALALVAGPVFCGWVCPLGLLLELGGALRVRLGRLLGVRADRLPDPRLPKGARGALLALALAFSVAAGLPLFQGLSPIHLLSRSAVFGLELASYGLLAWLAVELLVPRLWCRSLCPLGALYGLLGRRALLRVRVDPDEAGKIRCRRCDLACPMGIRVMEDHALAGRASVDDPDCTRCGACVDACPRGVLRLGFRDVRSRSARELAGASTAACAACERGATTAASPAAPRA